MERSKQDIVKQLDVIEAELFGLYRMIERLRLDLQSQWRVLPSDIEPAPRQAVGAK